MLYGAHILLYSDDAGPGVALAEFPFSRMRRIR